MSFAKRSMVFHLTGNSTATLAIFKKRGRETRSLKGEKKTRLESLWTDRRAAVGFRLMTQYVCCRGAICVPLYTCLEQWYMIPKVHPEQGLQNLSWNMPPHLALGIWSFPTVFAGQLLLISGGFVMASITATTYIYFYSSTNMHLIFIKTKHTTVYSSISQSLIKNNISQVFKSFYSHFHRFCKGFTNFQAALCVYMYIYIPFK